MVEVISRSDFLRDLVPNFWEKAELADKSPGVGQCDYLLPPGAQSPVDFTTKCTKCYNCVGACSHESLRVIHESNHPVDGYPVIIPREEPCYLCDEFLCISACTPKALTMDNTHLALGRLNLNEQTCLAFNNHYCFTCVNNCPETGEAIYSDKLGRPVIVEDKCTGCGICINVCPSENPGIRIITH